MQRALGWLVGLLLLGSVACAEEESTHVDVYALDAEDLLPQLVHASLRHLGDVPPELTEEQRAQYREHLVSEAEAAARAWILFLALTKDGSFRTVGRRGAQGFGSAPESRETQGTWTAVPEGIRLEPSTPHTRGRDSAWPSAPVVGTWENGALRFRASDETTFLLRRRQDVDGTLLALTPAERAASVRATLPAPSAEGEFEFQGDIFGWVTSPLRIGTLDIRVEAHVEDGESVWRVEETWDREAGGEWKRTVAWLDADLGVRRQQTDVKRSQTADPTDVEGHSVSVMTRTARGYRGETRLEGGEPRTWDRETEERPLATVGALLLLLRGCPDLPLTYECACQGEGEVLGSRFTVQGPGVLPSPGDRPGAGRAAWIAASASEEPESRGGTAVYLSPDDRRPLAVLAGFMSGVGGGAYGITAPSELPVRDLLPIDRPTWGAQGAAAQLALGTVWWIPEVIDGVLDWSALHAGAKERGFEGDEQTFRAHLLAKLERRSRSLSLAEGNEVLRAVNWRDGRAPAAEQKTRFEPVAPAAEFGVEARQTSEGWKVVGLHESIHAESRALDDAWTDPDRPEPVARGMRLWMWARKARVREMHNEAPAILHRMGPLAWPVLAKTIHEVGFPKGHLDGPTKLWAEELLRASVPASLLAHELATGAERYALYEALDGRVPRPYGRRSPRQPRASLPQPAVDRHPAEIPILLRVLRSDSAPLRRIAAGRLGQCGAMARDASSALEAALEDPDPQVREAAGIALEAARSREVVIRLAQPQRYGEACLYRGEPDGDPLLWARELEPFAVRVVLAGSLEPGRYTVCYITQHHAPLVLREVDVADPITSVGPVFLPRGSSIVLRDRRPRAGVAPSRLLVRATHLGAPPYERYGRYDEELGAHQMTHLGVGRFRVVVTPREGANAQNILLDRVVEVAGEKDVVVEFD